MTRLFFCLVMLGAAAGAWAHEGHEPVDTDFADQGCAQCQMKVTSRAYAAQIGTAGAPLFFDDVGCLVQYERQGKMAANDVHARYVRSAAGDAWLAVAKAVWVFTKEVRTPMGYGLHAFADPKAADAFAAAHAGARVLTWAQAAAAVPAKMGTM